MVGMSIRCASKRDVMGGATFATNLSMLMKNKSRKDYFSVSFYLTSGKCFQYSTKS